MSAFQEVTVDSGYKVRDAILMALNEVYGPAEVLQRDWYFCKMWSSQHNSYSVDANMQLVVDILSLVAFAHRYEGQSNRAKYYGKTLFNEIHSMIWMVHPGGSTAEYAAERVCHILNVEKGD